MFHKSLAWQSLPLFTGCLLSTSGIELPAFTAFDRYFAAPGLATIDRVSTLTVAARLEEATVVTVQAPCSE